MRTARTLQIAARNLASHAFRSSLTALGVVFGVGAVVGMMAISEGARRESIRQIEALGIDHIVVRSVKPLAGGDATVEGNAFTAVEYGITHEDILHLRTVFDNVTEVIAVKDTRQSVYVKGKRTDIQVFAVQPEFTRLTNCRLGDSRSRFLTHTDGLSSATSCIVGVDAARTLFRYRDSIGKTVAIGPASFVVKGLFHNPYNVQLAGGPNLNNV
ncbi:MAG: ABC transporter permease, partial [Planctomycetota bacterium]